ncbi:hypothetical protein SNEBB_003785 [Seison nebaliae]|nr:hypothetical protein SNEBB_003785 [Seison nebaliae]
MEKQFLLSQFLIFFVQFTSPYLLRPIVTEDQNITKRDFFLENSNDRNYYPEIHRIVLYYDTYYDDTPTSCNKLIFIGYHVDKKVCDVEIHHTTFVPKQIQTCTLMDSLKYVITTMFYPQGKIEQEIKENFSLINVNSTNESIIYSNQFYNEILETKILMFDEEDNNIATFIFRNAQTLNKSTLIDIRGVYEENLQAIFDDDEIQFKTPPKYGTILGKKNKTANHSEYTMFLQHASKELSICPGVQSEKVLWLFPNWSMNFNESCIDAIKVKKYVEYKSYLLTTKEGIPCFQNETRHTSKIWISGSRGVKLQNNITPIETKKSSKTIVNKLIRFSRAFEIICITHKPGHRLRLLISDDTILRVFIRGRIPHAEYWRSFEGTKITVQMSIYRMKLIYNGSVLISANIRQGVTALYYYYAKKKIFKPFRKMVLIHLAY